MKKTLEEVANLEAGTQIKGAKEGLSNEAAVNSGIKQRNHRQLEAAIEQGGVTDNAPYSDTAQYKMITVEDEEIMNTQGS